MKTDLKILVVDDFEMLHLFLRRELTDLGYTRISDAKDGAVALALLNEAQASGEPFDVVFSDWNMPELNGLELLIEMKKQEHFKHIPFVLITAEGETIQINKAMKAGATDYLIKPIAGEALKEKLSVILAAQK